MSDRITNADTERMLRELSGGAFHFANFYAHALKCFSHVYGYHGAHDMLLDLDVRAESIVGIGYRHRARALVMAYRRIIERRYEIRDRWGM